MNSICLTHGYADGHYVLPPLPYDVSELEQLVGSETLLLHHDKHHAAYVAGANAAADELKKINNGTLPLQCAADITQKLAFHLGGHLLHTLYWHNMVGSPSGLPQGELALVIERSFGSFDSFCKLFSTIAESVQGSGWAVLGVDPVSRGLMICGIKRHQDALVPGFFPLLACDVWEHAYYLKWKNNRKGYVEAFMQHINWDSVSELFEQSYCHEC
ncbi:MAG: superoxide dismutase [Akkermansiaceae bacterium]|nr:superoxide dismutase [Akkermansiaceae bacterium]